jgi:hypothetical protein
MAMARSAASIAVDAAQNAAENAEKSIDDIRDEKINDVEIAGTFEIEKIHEAANKRLGEFDAVGAVRFDRQVLDDKRKGQAKANIDAGGAIVCEASGETVTIADASDQPLRGLKLYGKSVQDGTPTPENPVEIESAVVSRISSVGANLFDLSNRLHGEIDSNGDLRLLGGMVDFYKYTFKERTQYTLSGYVKNKNTTGRVRFRVCYTDETSDKDVLLNEQREWGYRTFTTQSGKTVDRITMWFSDSGEMYIKGCELMINEGTTALPYEPYKGGSATLAQPVTLPGIPVSSGGNYTDANGQRWICDEMDFARGVYVQKVGRVDMGTLNWTYNESELRFASAGVTGAKNDVRLTACLAVGYDAYYRGEALSEVKDKGVYFAGRELYVHDSAYTDAATFKAAMSGVMLYYELATPVETPISETDLTAYRTLHTNKPITTVYTDSNAELAVEYVADTKTYIDNKFAELAAAVLQNA